MAIRKNLKTLLLALTLAPLCSVTAVAALPTPIIHLKLNEGEGTTAADTGSGTAANGTLNGTAGWTPNAPNGNGSSLSIYPDGTNNNSVSLSSAKLDGLTQFTISTWINLRDTPINGAHILSSMKDGLGIGFVINNPPNGYGDISAANFRLTLGVNGQYSTNYDGGGDQNKVLIDADDKWVFVAASYNSSTRHVSFFFGDETSGVIQLGSTATLNMPTAGSIVGNASGARLEIGNHPGNNRNPNAWMHDLSIYDSILTIEQLNEIRLQSIPEAGTTALLICLGTALTLLLTRRRKN